MSARVGGLTMSASIPSGLGVGLRDDVVLEPSVVLAGSKKERRLLFEPLERSPQHKLKETQMRGVLVEQRAHAAPALADRLARVRREAREGGPVDHVVDVGVHGSLPPRHDWLRKQGDHFPRRAIQDRAQPLALVPGWNIDTDGLAKAALQRL